MTRWYVDEKLKTSDLCTSFCNLGEKEEKKWRENKMTGGGEIKDKKKWNKKKTLGTIVAGMQEASVLGGCGECNQHLDSSLTPSTNIRPSSAHTTYQWSSYIAWPAPERSAFVESDEDVQRNFNHPCETPSKRLNHGPTRHWCYDSHHKSLTDYRLEPASFHVVINRDDYLHPQMTLPSLLSSFIRRPARPFDWLQQAIQVLTYWVKTDTTDGYKKKRTSRGTDSLVREWRSLRVWRMFGSPWLSQHYRPWRRSKESRTSPSHHLIPAHARSISG